MADGIEKGIKDILAAGIDIEIFRLGRPVAAEQGLHAAAHNPAGRGLGFRSQSKGRTEAVKAVLDVDERYTTGNVEQRWAGCVTETPADGPVPISLDPESIGKTAQIPKRAIDSEKADIALDAGNPLRCELPVKSRLRTAGENRTAAVNKDAGHIRESSANLRRANACIHAEVEAGPVVNRYRRRLVDRRALEVRRLRRACNHKRRERDATKPPVFHDYSPAAQIECRVSPVKRVTPRTVADAIPRFEIKGRDRKRLGERANGHAARDNDCDFARADALCGKAVAFRRRC